LFQSLLEAKGISVDYRQSKVSNKGLKQALMNRLRVWFERGKIVFPYGNDATRRVVNQMLEELEAHAWKNADIVDTGPHNDLVMALAHAVDQFSYKNSGAVWNSRSSGRGEWSGGKAKTKGSSLFRSVRRR
jgi:hypothetical protein